MVLPSAHYSMCISAYKIYSTSRVISSAMGALEPVSTLVEHRSQLEKRRAVPSSGAMKKNKATFYCTIKSS